MFADSRSVGCHNEVNVAAVVSGTDILAALVDYVNVLPQLW